MAISRSTSRMLPRAGVVAALVLAVGTLVPAVAATAAAPDAPERARPSLPAGPPPKGVSSRPAAGKPAARSAEGGPTLTLRRKDAKRSRDGTSTTLVDGSCMPFASAAATGVGHDEFLEEVGGANYFGGVSCNFDLDYLYGDVFLVDRSPSFNGQWFDGQGLVGRGFAGWGSGGGAAGGMGVLTRYYDGARVVEPVLSVTLFAPYDMYWDYCGWVPGLRFYACDGVGTSVLYVLVGGQYTSTGLTAACRDQSVAGDPEQARLRVLSGSTPASTQILGAIPSIRSRVIAFKRSLCSTGAAGASGFARSQGQQLWDNAVAEAKNPATQNDDRPLYWARLSMTTALEQWRPGFGVDRAALQDSLDRAARGMDSHGFTLGTARKVLATGFDPFQLEGGGITRGNPSAAAVLGLDGTTVAGAEVQVVVFPVRYADFDAGVVESVVRSHLEAGGQQATLITTVSQGGDDFELEKWNGRNRTEGTDNRNMPSNGSATNPVEPVYQTAGKQFAATTLPVDAMKVGSPFAVRDDVTLTEILNGTIESRTQPTDGWRAVEGSGGGYLSNEVAYRVTELRDQLGSPVRAGHVHTPALFVPPDAARRNAIVTQYRQILAAAVGAGGPPGGGSPECGEPSCTPVQEAYISHYTGAGCTGTESYYTPYFYYDGVRRSWDGQGLAGTTLRTVTNRSWRDWNGACHDDWPDGNTLSDFVTIYR